MSKPINGKDVDLKLVLNSKSTEPRRLSIVVSAQVMNYNGSSAVNIMMEEKEETLPVGKGYHSSPWGVGRGTLFVATLYLKHLLLFVCAPAPPPPPPLDLSLPILIPFSTYHKHMMDGDNIKISAVVTDMEKPANVYLAEDNVVLQEPPLAIVAVTPCHYRVVQ